MHARKMTTKTISKEKYKDYQDKARQFFGVMRMCLQDGEWDAVVLNGVHACISMSDALCAFHSGLRSSSRDHRDASILLSQSLGKKEGVTKNASRLAEIIDYKSRVSYEPIQFTSTNAHSFAQKVERFFAWSEKLLP